MKGVFKIGYLRNILIASSIIAIGLPVGILLIVFPSFSTMLIDITEDEAIRLARHLTITILADQTELSRDSLPISILQETNRLAKEFGLMKLKIFSKSGEILYSSDSKEIGEVNEKRYFHDIVAKGEVYTKVVEKDTPSLEGQIVTADVVETYVPIINNAAFIGALEIYYDITDRKRRLDKLILTSSVALILLAISLQGAIIIILFRAANDINQRTQTEEALRESEEKYRILFESSKDSNYISTRGGDIVEANQSLLDLFGYTRAEIFEWKAQNSYVNPDDRPRFKKEIEENGFVKDFEVKLRKKDGTELDCLVTASVRLSREGSIVGYQGIIRDVTELKRSEEALRESEQKYRTVLESNPDPVVVYDTEGKVLYLNPAFTRVFGWSSKERFRKKMDVFVPEEAWRETKMMLDKVLAGEAFSGIETHRYTKEGKLIPVSISGAAYRDLEGNHVGTVVNLRDISEQKRLEAQLQQAQKLEAIGILAGGLAHDFNNLLTIIVGNIGLAKDEIKPEVGISENLSEAEKASLRAKELIKQLITFSKGGEPVKEVGPIGDLVKDTTNLAISGSNAKCEFSLPENLWLLEFDEGQMKHAIKNLIDNAIEAMPDGGSIDVVAENVEIDSETKAPDLPLSKGKYIKIAIKDKGIGIPEDHLSKIFDPYFSTKEMGVQKGMGMGLATTYSIINRHEGHITAESELGVGTTFTIYLPVAVEEKVGLEPVKMVEPEKPAVLTGRILVMDDEEMIRKLSTKMLSRLGYEPELAQDGAEAIELYKRAMDSAKPFDAVILDLTVKGGMGGKDAVTELLEINPQVKAIVSSGYSNDPEMSDFRKYGFVGALPKPYAVKDLKDVLNKIIKE